MNTDHRVPRHTSKGKKRKNNNNSLKVVYISSPMKVKTSASKFRSLVQELTGKNSDISQYMDDDNSNGNNSRSIGFFEETNEMNQNDSCQTSVSQEDTPTSSESFLEPRDDVFTSLQFEGIFSTDISFYDPSEMDVLGSFDELL